MSRISPPLLFSSVLLLFSSAAFAAEPVKSAWIMGPGPFQPDVRAVEIGAGTVVVHSGGISLRQLGPLATVPQPREEIREFAYRIPIKPERETGIHAHIPREYSGTLLNGVPIYNQFEAASYRGRNLWHYDMVARNKATAQAGLIEALIPDGRRHSPIIGFALDGFPVYGPWGNTESGLRRLRSSYRLRSMTVRDRWPDGTRLAPGQYGPEVDAEYPLGSFIEDYAYVPGSGDLDQYNGRFSKTPEYPDGTYAYYLATDVAGAEAFPYLTATEFAGVYEPEPLRLPLVSLRRPQELTAGTDVVLQLDGLPRNLEYVHERPIHLFVVSEDLTGFDHIHPEVNEYGFWQVPFRFTWGGRYRIYTEYTPPGENQRLDSFDVAATGPPRPARPWGKPDFVSKAGEDTILEFPVPAASLQPWLGAWAHVAIAGEGWKSFVHAHPLDEGESLKPSEVHSHGADVLGTPPSKVRVPVSFSTPGLYRVWVQYQVAGKVETHPYVVQADQSRRSVSRVRIPNGAVQVKITAHGFEPARVEVPAGKPVTLAFVRSAEPNCGSRVVFAGLGIAKDVPLGGMALVTLSPQPTHEIMFACGMGMLRGSVVALAVK